MVQLENDAFLVELTKLFQKSKTTGSLFLTMKRYDGRTKPVPKDPSKAAQQANETHEYKCLVRATLGNKKLATIISQKDVNRFQLAYCNLLKGNMDGLKKKEKKSAKGKKAKATQ